MFFSDTLVEGDNEPLPPSQGQSFPFGPCLLKGSEAPEAHGGGTFQHLVGNVVHSGAQDLEGERLCRRYTHEEPQQYFQLRVSGT